MKLKSILGAMAAVLLASSCLLDDGSVEISDEPVLHAGSALATDYDGIEVIDVNMTPQHLSLTTGFTRFLRCNISSEYLAGSVAFSLSVEGAEPISAVKVESHIEEHDTGVLFFFVDNDDEEYNDVRDMLAGSMGEVTLTLTITRAEGADLVGIDTIMVVE